MTRKILFARGLGKLSGKVKVASRKFAFDSLYEDGSNMGRTPLMYALMSKGSKSVVEALLKAGGDLELRDCDGNTSLTYAAKYGCWECVPLLLKRGADPFVSDNFGKRAIDYAISKRNW